MINGRFHLRFTGLDFYGNMLFIFTGLYSCHRFRATLFELSERYDMNNIHAEVRA